MTYRKSGGERFGALAWAPYWEVILTHLPLEHLRENAVNRIELYSDKRYTSGYRYRMPDMLPVRAYADALGIELPWYGGPTGKYMAPWDPPEGATSVYDVHSGWFMAPRSI